MPTFRDYQGRTITTDMNKEELARIYAEHAPDSEYSWYWITRFVHERGQRLAEEEARRAALSAVQPSAGTLHRAINFLGDLFLLANGRGLQRPRLRLHYKEMRFKVYLVKPRRNRDEPYNYQPPVTICFTSGDLVYSHEKGCMDPVGDERYVGCLRPDNGEFLPARVNSYGNSTAWQEGRVMSWSRRPFREVLPLEREFLDRMASDPIEFMAECSRNMGQCCYCGLPLEDDRSKTVGYGPVCAVKWGLPWGDEVEADQGKSFAQVWGESSDVRGMCAAVRNDPTDEVAWMILNDALIGAGVWGGGVSKPDAKVFSKFLIPARVQTETVEV